MDGNGANTARGRPLLGPAEDDSVQFAGLGGLVNMEVPPEG